MNKNTYLFQAPVALYKLLYVVLLKDCKITADLIVTAVRNQDREGAADWSRSWRFGYALFSPSLVITCAYVTV